MTRVTLKTLAVAAALFLAAVLPVVAGTGQQVPVNEAIKTFFQERGVDPQYLDKGKAEVPADQWKRILEICATVDDPNNDWDDRDQLNSLVFSALTAVPKTIGDSVYMIIGTTLWQNELTELE